MTLTTPQVKVRFRYEVDGVQIYASSAPSINMTSDSELKITFRGSFYDYRTAGVDFLSDELHVIASINGDEYNLGYYIITSEKLSADDGITTIEVEGYSRLYLLKQSKIEARAYFAAGTLYTDAIYALLTDAGITNYNLTPSTLTLATAREDWEVGTDRLTIINALLSEMSYSSAYVDHDGKIQLTPTVEATPANVGITYLADRYSIIGADYTMSADRHGKPNVFMVMCSNPELTAPLTSVIENDSEDNPYSTAYRPRVLSVTKVDNIASQTALDNFAFNLMAKSLLSDETVTFETMLNPEHTVNDILALGNGDLSGVFSEIGWTMTLDANAAMTHTARRTVGYLSGGIIIDVPKVLSYYGTATALSVARYKLTAASVGNYALFGGGHTGSANSAVVDAYDTLLVKSTPTALSTARYSLAAASIGNYALFGGGYSNITTVNAYDTTLARTQPTALSVGRSTLAASNVGNYVLFGGGASSSPSAAVDAYNSSLVRSTPTSLSTARNFISATNVGDYALFGGGYDSAISAVVDAYDTSLTRTTPTALSVARRYIAATHVENYALFGGGSGYTTVDAYDASLTRTTPTALSAGRSYLAAANVGEYALFGGGSTNSMVVDAYDALLTRTTPTVLSVGRSDLAAAYIGDYALFGGGNAGSASAVVDVYQVV